MMTGQPRWMHLLLLSFVLLSTNLSQAGPIEHANAEVEAFDKDAVSLSHDVELLAEVPVEDGDELLNELVPARPTRRIIGRVRVIIIRIRKKN
ncbi:unnamed protein product [Rodentolepis nana]|uniref:Secreted protein n=1 Tax=Rodentolepis nana TaxID=102285 RepID=A0A0R3TIR5_RODNA|nr:unnamed protein product [Rodentolepis nana]